MTTFFLTLLRALSPMTSSIMRRLAFTLVPVTALLAACGGKPEAATVAVATVSIAADNMSIVDSGLVESGPLLSGTLMAQRTAELRAQVTGTLLEVYVSEGAVVTSGQPLARIEAAVLDDQARSAVSQLRSAEASAAVATRNAERAERLYAAGAVAERDLEAARNQAIAAGAMVADAQSRLALARKQLANATLRAPFRGVVSERAASAGDVLQMGSPVITVIDPTSLELEAGVPAATLSGVTRGAKVEFSVSGYPGRTFTGTIARVNPAVDPTTRQVRIYIVVPNGDRALATGLFAEGRVAISQSRGLAIPLTAIDPKATTPSVRRIRAGKVELVPVTLGLRDDIAERVEVRSGVVRGDTLLLGAALGTPEGSLVRVSRADR